MNYINGKKQFTQNEERRLSLLTEKAWQLLIHKRMKGVDKMKLRKTIEAGHQQQ
jgi:hypothetical protein